MVAAAALWWTLAAAQSVASPAQTTRSGAPTLVLDHARVLDVDGERWRDDHAVVVRAGKIVAVTPSAALAQTLAPAAGEPVLRIDLDGRALVPGLIDLHTHLLLHPYDETPWDEQVLKEPLELRTIRAGVAARATLAAGFTTIRDLGTEGAGFADVALRDAIGLGILSGPRIVTTTRAIVATACYGPQGFEPRANVPKGAEEADGADGVRKAVREQIAAGADWIKLYADYRRRAGEPATPTFSEAELKAAVDEAASAGRRVAVHATTDEGMRRAALAGAATIEHGDGASDATLALVKERRVALCPTLAAVEAIALQSGWKPGGEPPPRLAHAKEVVRHALAAGVTIACGSDAGVFAHGTNAREIELLVEAGLSPAQALRAATATAARLLARDDLGRIDAGACADLVAVDGDPLAHASALREVALVVKEGAVAVDRRAAATPAGSAAERDGALAFCRRFLEDYSKPDFDAVERAFAPDATIVIDEVASARRQTLPVAKFLASMREHRSRMGPLREWIVGEPVVLVDDGIATVWAPFRLEVAGGGGHGVDVFQLVKLPPPAGATGDEPPWRIAALAFTFRGDR